MTEKIEPSPLNEQSEGFHDGWAEARRAKNRTIHYRRGFAAGVDAKRRHENGGEDVPQQFSLKRGARR